MRREREDDIDDIDAVTRTAFGRGAEAKIVRKLRKDGDSVLSMVAHNDRELLGHVQFFRIGIDGADLGLGLGPLSVLPAAQRGGVGSGLVRTGLLALEGAGERIVFVLGHEAYYPRFGFDAGKAAAFSAPWSGDAFMALALGDDAPNGGVLTYPAAFGNA